MIPRPLDPPRTRHQELADFLRSRRQRLTPDAVGLPSGLRRLTAGLRREEVAQLAGIGVDWYVRLEQGRPVSPSSTTVDALARALRLTAVEHAHLRALTSPPSQRLFEPEVLPTTLRRVVEGQDQPAYVTGRRWDVLAWNVAADELFGFSALADSDRNTLILLLTHARARGLFGEGWAQEARRVVSQFRATHDLWAADPAFVDLLDRLRAGCPEFDTWWDAHDIGGPLAGRKLLRHPEKGELSYEYATFQANDDPGLRLALYTPGGD